MTFADFISRFPVARSEGNSVKVLCPAHTDKQPSLSVSRSKTGGVALFCHAGCSTEEVVASLGLTLRDLFVEEPKKKFKVPARAKAVPEAQAKAVIEKTYSYTDVAGNELYQSVRLKPKSFRQRHLVKDKWVWNMEGVERVLFNLPAVTVAPEVWIVEGEKDADNLNALGLVATCNVAGAKKWLDSYNVHLAGKNVVLCGDNDEPGQEHMDMVFESLSSVVKAIKRVTVPPPHKDVSDFILACKDSPRSHLDLWVEQAVPHYGGVKMPIYSMGELELMYKRTLKAESNLRLDLSKWLPSLRALRPFVPGDVVLVAGGTGVGKTALAQNIARISAPLMTVLFEMELPGEVIFERHIAMHHKLTAREVENQYLTTGDTFGEELLLKTFPNTFVCPESRLTPERFEELIRRSELKTGRPANLVLLDYAQLMEGEGESRYERASYVAEQVKIIAKSTRTIIIVFSQISRPGKDDKGIGLFSSKDSGSWENSCGAMMGVWRDLEDETLLHLRVFKATRGGSGTEVFCNFDGARTLITERARTRDDL